MKLGLISLGCAKNQIDSELFLGVAKEYNIEITSNIDEADVIVINTCAFIKDAKKEAIRTIIETLDYQSLNKKVVVMGCLVERYYEEIMKDIPEVDYYIPIKDYKSIHEFFNYLTNSSEIYRMDYTKRVLTTSPVTPYLKIADGCNNKCAYCAIPLIRGPFRSRPLEDIIEEAKILANNGAKEITLIAQDTTRYGTDLDSNLRLEDILHKISLIDSIQWIRVLYLYPDEITDSLLKEFQTNEKVVKYFDIPIQHASNKMLKLMNRRGTKELIQEKINQIKRSIPNATLRSTLITGFPQETNEDYEELKEFIIQNEFDRLGIFSYSREEDTPAYSMTPRVPKKVANSRKDELLKIQKMISFEKNQKRIGNKCLALIEDYDYENFAYTGRDPSFAPDDVDGKIYIYSDEELTIGSFYQIEIISAGAYDLIGKLSN